MNNDQYKPLAPFLEGRFPVHCKPRVKNTPAMDELTRECPELIALVQYSNFLAGSNGVRNRTLEDIEVAPVNFRMTPEIDEAIREHFESQGYSFNDSHPFVEFTRGEELVTVNTTHLDGTLPSERQYLITITSGTFEENKSLN